MAGGGRVFGGDGSGSTLASLLHSQSVLPPSSSDGFFLSGSSPSLCSRAMVSFEDVPGGNGLGGSFFRLIEHDENGDDDIDDYFHQPEKKRRLTLDQVQFLEKSFEVENKLEPERKVQLAKDLGLQPRQVAIWFQNRRARWKTKQLEKDYEVLQSNYNNLKVDFDNLIKERDQLKAEVLDLTDKLLLKAEEENSKPSSRASERPPGQVVCLVSNEVSEVPVPVCKHDDISSIKSDIVDSDSPNYTDGALLELGDSSYVFEPDQSDLSQDEEDVPSNSFLPLHMSSPKVENSDHYPGPLPNSCSFGFNPEDHAFWSWSY